MPVETMSGADKKNTGAQQYTLDYFFYRIIFLGSHTSHTSILKK
jgi:hypothetical protein